MRQMNSIILALLPFALLFTLAGNAYSADYQHSIDVDKMKFSWSIDGDKLAASVSGPTTSWVAVGFNPTNTMKNADIIIGYVKKGKVTIKDEFGTSGSQHKSDKKIGGESNVTVVGGSEENGVTTIEFTIPLNSGDVKDTTIVPDGDTVLIFAYGKGRDSFRVKHQFRTTLTVNLSTGEVK